MLTPEEKKIIEYGKKSGKTQQESLSALAKYRTQIRSKEEPIVEPKKNIAKKLFDFVTASEKGVAEAVASTEQTFTSEQADQLAQDSGRLIEQAKKLPRGDPRRRQLLETAQSVSSTGQTQAEERLGQIPSSGKVAMDVGFTTLDLLGAGTFGKTAKTMRTGELFRALPTAVQVPKDFLKAGVKTGKEVVETGKQAGSKLFGKVKTATDPITGEIARIPSRIATNYAEKQAVETSIKQLPSQVAQTAVRDGVDIVDVKTIISSAKQVNKSALRELVTKVKNFASGVSKENPIEVVGKPIVAGLKRLEKYRVVVGKKLGETAKNLGKVTKEEIEPIVFAELKKVPGLEGLTKTMNGVLDFSKTTAATLRSKPTRMAIRSIYDDAIKSGTGLSKHLLRQEEFALLGGKKRALIALTETEDLATNAIRKGLATVLEGKNAGYKALNQEFAKLMKPLSDMRKLMKAIGTNTDDDILNMSAGLLARRLTSHAPSNPQVRAILRAIDKVTKKVGTTEASAETLQDVYNILNKYYDIAGGTTFQSGVKSGVEKATGLFDFAISQARNVAGESVAVRQKALEKLLGELLK